MSIEDRVTQIDSASYQWATLEDVDPELVKAIENGVIEHGRRLASAGKAKPIVCVVRENDTLVAGASGRTEYTRLFINYLWVTEAIRSQGIGTELLNRIEAAARERDCTDALIETLDDRVASLYTRLGYQPIAVIPDYVGPFSRHILVKTLVDERVFACLRFCWFKR